LASLSFFYSKEKITEGLADRDGEQVGLTNILGGFYSKEKNI
jgi:hypothetical protein